MMLKHSSSALRWLIPPQPVLRLSILLMVLSSVTGFSQSAAQWSIISSYPPFEYTHVAAADSRNVVAAGTHRQSLNVTFLRVSEDGGITWRNVWTDTMRITPTGLTKPIEHYKVAYPALDMMVSVSDSGFVWTSSDGGVNLTRRRVAESGAGLWGLDMYSRTDGIASTSDSVYITVDGWNSWSTPKLPSPAGAESGIWGVQMPAPGVVFLTRYVDRRMELLRSDDTGRSWRITELKLYAPYLFMLDTDYGWSVGIKHDSGSIYNGKDLVLRTTDGGESWDTLLFERIAPTYGLYTVNFYDRDFGLAGGPLGKILVTTDGGLTWTKENTGLSPHDFTNISGIAYLSRERAIAVTAVGQILVRQPVSSIIHAERDADDGLRVAVHSDGSYLTITHEGLRQSGGDVSLYNIMGTKVANQSVTPMASGQTSAIFSTGSLPSGIYFVVVATEGRYDVRKVQVRH